MAGVDSIIAGVHCIMEGAIRQCQGMCQLTILACVNCIMSDVHCIMTRGG